MESRKGFTLIELMVVIFIVSMVAAAVVPLVQGHIDTARWSEERTIMGTIATALHTHVVEKGSNFTAVPR
jgi:prepilin-type N-terminal cleavage/methylation domain-containing protein